MPATATAHRQTRASNGAEVDEGIVDLLEALWACGMDTEFSCQGDHDKPAHICFARADDAYRFMNAPGDFVVTVGVHRAWVDFPSAQIRSLCEYWASILNTRTGWQEGRCA